MTDIPRTPGEKLMAEAMAAREREAALRKRFSDLVEKVETRAAALHRRDPETADLLLDVSYAIRGLTIGLFDVCGREFDDTDWDIDGLFE